MYNTDCECDSKAKTDGCDETKSGDNCCPPGGTCVTSGGGKIWTKFVNVDVPGFNIGAALDGLGSEVACLDSCEAQSTCVSALYNAVIDRCYIKTVTLATSGMTQYNVLADYNHYELRTGCAYRGCQK